MKQTKISLIKLDGSAKEYVRQAQACGLYGSIAKHGVLCPVVIDSEMKIRFGRKRLASAHALGLKTIPAVTNDDAGEAEILAENLHRWHGTPEERADMVKRYAELMGDEVIESGEKPRKRTKTEKVEQIAKDTGLSPRTVWGDLSEEQETPKDKVDGIETWEMSLEPEDVEALTRHRNHWHKIVSTAKLLTNLFMDASCRTNLDECITLSRNLAKFAQEHSPYCLCAWCQGNDSDCPYCMGQRFNDKSMMADAEQQALHAGLTVKR